LAALQRQYPQSPWTSQGQVLMAFMDERAAFEETQRRLQAELRSREATIRKLLGQLDRSREIDIEMEKKERELLR
jgi:DNA-binding IclR family transcriptional regulator